MVELQGDRDAARSDAGHGYEEKSDRMADGEIMVLTSDGITEAHSPEGEMYGFSRLMGRVARRAKGDDMVTASLRLRPGEMDRARGRTGGRHHTGRVRRTSSASRSAGVVRLGATGSILANFSLPSLEGNERVAIDRVAEAVDPASVSSSSQFEKLKTAVGETVMNAIEHGNENDPDLDVLVEVAATPERSASRCTDHGGGKDIPDATTPDIEAKLAGEQTPRGLGLFPDRARWWMRSTAPSENGSHIVELVMNREGEA